MSNNPALDSLRRIIAGARHDLKKLRDINSALTEKVAAMTARKEFRPEFIEQEAAKLQHEARLAVASYMQRFDPFGPFTSPVFGDGYWSNNAFLARALTVPDPTLLAANETATWNPCSRRKYPCFGKITSCSRFPGRARQRWERWRIMPTSGRTGRRWP